MVLLVRVGLFSSAGVPLVLRSIAGKERDLPSVEQKTASPSVGKMMEERHGRRSVYDAFTARFEQRYGRYHYGSCYRMFRAPLMRLSYDSLGHDVL